MNTHWLLSALLLLTVPAFAEVPEQAALEAEARLITKELLTSLKEALLTTLTNQGPVEAIAVCSEEAPDVARTLARRHHGWSVGRTSLKVRNPKNKPSRIERITLEQFESKRRAGTPPEKLETSEIVDIEGRREFRYMKAISTAALCLTCHGDPIAVPVRDRIRSQYPHDRAIGYRVGDLRGAVSLRRSLPAP